MNTKSQPPMPPSVDRVFLALGQTLYTCQLFEATLLEVLASAHEVLSGVGDGTQFQASIETLSKQTLGQLLLALRKVADIRPDIDAQLGSALETRNLVVHRFAVQVGDDLTLERNILDHQRALYEKCSLILEANSTAVSVLQALARLQSERSRNMAAKLELAAMRCVAFRYKALSMRSNPSFEPTRSGIAQMPAIPFWVICAMPPRAAQRER